MKKIETVIRDGLFNINDKYDVFRDNKGFYGICKEGMTISHCAYKTIESVLKSKQIPRITAMWF